MVLQATATTTITGIRRTDVGVTTHHTFHTTGMLLPETEPSSPARSTDEVEITPFQSSALTIAKTPTTRKRGRRTSADNIGEVVDSSQHETQIRLRLDLVTLWSNWRQNGEAHL